MNKDVLFVVAVVVFCVFFMWIGQQSKRQEEYAQCDGSTRYYVWTGKIYACKNYVKKDNQPEEELPI